MRLENLKIRKGEKKDITSLYKLIKELAIYEKSEHKLIISQDSLFNDCFKEKPSYNFIVGEFNNEIIGIAMYYIRYSSWKGEVLYLEDLIVTEKHRGKGIGFALFSKFIKYSHNLNVKRVQWVVLDWNTSAIDFYKKNGAIILDDWRVALMDDKAIQKFVKNEGI